MWTLRSLVLAHVIVTALSAPSEAALHARHIAEPPREQPVDEGDAHEVASARPRVIGAVRAAIERAGEASIDAMYKEAGPIVMLTVQLQLDLL